MADINTVIPKIASALDEAYLVAGQPSVAAQIAALQAQVAALTTERDAAAALAAARKVVLDQIKASAASAP